MRTKKSDKKDLQLESNLKNKKIRDQDLPVYIPKPGCTEIQTSFIKHFVKTVNGTNLPISSICNMLSVPEKIVKLWLSQGKELYDSFIEIKKMSTIEKRLYTFYTQVINAEAVRENKLSTSLIDNGRDLKWYLQQMYPAVYDTKKSDDDTISSIYSDLSEDELIKLIKET
jgi:hypothetical protein